VDYEILIECAFHLVWFWGLVGAATGRSFSLAEGEVIL
jgi:hypothetical protein